MHDVKFKFADGQALSGTNSQNSTNVYNAGSALLMFQGDNKVSLEVIVTAVGGTNPTFEATFVGADDAALTSNVVTLAESGISGVLTTALLPLKYSLYPMGQVTAKQYYGVIFDQGGTTPTATVEANLAFNGQSNLLK